MAVKIVALGGSLAQQSTGLDAERAALRPSSATRTASRPKAEEIGRAHV